MLTHSLCAYSFLRVLKTQLLSILPVSSSKISLNSSFSNSNLISSQPLIASSSTLLEPAKIYQKLYATTLPYACLFCIFTAMTNLDQCQISSRTHSWQCLGLLTKFQVMFITNIYLGTWMVSCAKSTVADSLSTKLNANKL